MHGLFSIAVREWRSMFGRPLAYAILALFVLLFALFTLWFDDWLVAGSASLRRPLYWASACLLLLVPAITMRTLSDEWRSGTWAVLGALPLGPSEIVVGKWLGAVGFVGVALALTLPWPIALFVLGDPDPGPIVLGYLGLWLGAGALAAVGVAASSLTESQVVAFLATLALGLVPWLVGQALPLVPAVAGEIPPEAELGREVDRGEGQDDPQGGLPPPVPEEDRPHRSRRRSIAWTATRRPTAIAAANATRLRVSRTPRARFS